MKLKGLIQPGMCVAVMGLGITGQAAVRYCLECGAKVLVSDNRESERFEQEVGQFLRDTSVKWEAGGHTVEFLSQADLVIVSPGIPYGHKIIRNISEQGIQVVGELAVAASQIDVPVIAVTGTNGKTTVTSIIGEILEKAGKKVFIGGNIGTPLFAHLCSSNDAEVIVLEVSSFQLQMAGDFAPDIAVLLNITPDHLDWHCGLDGYIQAKMNVFRNQTAQSSAILCRDDAGCMALADEIPARVLTFGRDKKSSAILHDVTVAVEHQGELLEFNLSGTSLGNSIGTGNAAAAILATLSLGIDPEVVRRGVREFEPAPHRLQLVGSVAEVSYVDDSKATNTGAVIAALQQVKGKALLIAGGKDKGEDYSLLCESVRQKTREVIVIGEAGEKIATALNGCVTVKSATSMEDAVRVAQSLAQPGDTVLLSPACASFDMFTSYGHRGEVFTAAVEKLISERQDAAGGTG